MRWFGTTVLLEVIEVDAPVDTVFALVADFANAQAWDPGVASSTQVGVGVKERIGVGAAYDLTVVFRGRSSHMRYVTTAFTPPSSVTLGGVGPKLVATDTIACEPTPTGGTRVTYRAELRLIGASRLATPLLRKAFHTMGERALAGMRSWLAAASTPGPLHTGA